MLIHTDKDINYNSEAEWKPKRNRKEIACCSWTTASGQVTPILFKMQDEDGIIRTFDKIHVNHSEKKLYAGIPLDVMRDGVEGLLRPAGRAQRAGQRLGRENGGVRPGGKGGSS